MGSGLLGQTPAPRATGTLARHATWSGWLMMWAPNLLACAWQALCGEMFTVCRNRLAQRVGLGILSRVSKAPDLF